MTKPKDPVVSLASVSPDNFKAAMRHFASTVNVVTSRSCTFLNGMTATAVCSVSTEPPSILIVVNQKNRTHEIIRQSGVYTVNVLSARQEALAVHFSSVSATPFASVPHSFGMSKCPIIDGCTSFMECVVASQTIFGTHSIFLGRVIASGGNGDQPLVYHDRQFRSFKPYI
jgi:flavin reductase